MTILVAGATGNVGGELVRHLAGAGIEVRGLVRDANRAALPAGVVPAVGDLDRPETVSSALAGVSGVFFLSGYRDMPGLLAEARRARVDRVVLLSSSSAPTGDTENAVARYHILSEAAVRDSGIPWTFLQPCSFMSNALRWAPQIRAGAVVRDAFPGVRVASIDPRDIAAVAARALTAEGHDGKSYLLTGPDALLPADRVSILAKVLGRDLRFEGLSNADARAEMSRSMPAAYVDGFFSFFVDGKLDESIVRPTVEEVLGRPPHSFEAWAIENVGAFSEPPVRRRRRRAAVELGHRNEVERGENRPHRHVVDPRARARPRSSQARSSRCVSWHQPTAFPPSKARRAGGRPRFTIRPSAALILCRGVYRYWLLIRQYMHQQPFEAPLRPSSSSSAGRRSGVRGRMLSFMIVDRIAMDRGDNMQIEHAGQRPVVDPTAWIAPNAILSGAGSVGAPLDAERVAPPMGTA